MNIIITTVGTSLFTNYLKKEVLDCASKIAQSKSQTFDEKSYKDAYDSAILQATANITTLYENHIKPYFLWNMKKQIDVLKDEYDDNEDLTKITWLPLSRPELNKNASAEIQSIEAILDKKNLSQQDYKIYLLHTATSLSELAAKILCQDVYKSKTVCVPVAGLEVKTSKTFNDEGFKTLADEILKILDAHKNDKVVLNITGGYKGIIPIATLIGQLLNIPIFYIYEDSETPIEIAQLPINFDWSSIESIASYMTAEYLESIPPHSDLYKLFDSAKLVKVENGVVKISGIGQILHKTLFKGALSNSILGNFIEYKLYHHFCIAQNEIFSDPIIMDKFNPPLCYKFINEDNCDIQNCEVNDKSNPILPAGYKELGDIDLVLRYREQDALCEVKSHNQIVTTFHAQMNTDKDYYFKIKARIEYWKKEKKQLPKAFLFIVHKIKILQQQEIAMNTDAKLMDVLKYFSERVQRDYSANVHFVAKGVWIELKKDKPEINYTELFRKPVIMEYLIPPPELSKC